MKLSRKRSGVVEAMPQIEILQVQYLVKYVVELMGALVGSMGGVMERVGAGVAAQSEDPQTMAELTTGIFGTNSGLVYWLNGWMFDVVSRLPYCDLGVGMHTFLAGLKNGASG